jgi:hypothetical protein
MKTEEPCALKHIPPYCLKFHTTAKPETFQDRFMVVLTSVAL